MRVASFHPFATVRRQDAATLGAPVATAPSSSTPWIIAGIVVVGALGLYAYSRRTGSPGEAPILIKGKGVSLLMTDGRVLRSPRTYGMIHDPSGVYLPPSDVYIGPYELTRSGVDLDRSGKQYFGSRYDAELASVSPPSGAWRHIGHADEILYDRDRGVYSAPIPYAHEFKHPVSVSQNGSWKRLELPPGAVVNWRGFVSP